jgi:hypothetical protein
MRTILKFILLFIIIVISYNYFQLNQDGNLRNANHFEEFGKSTGEAVTKMKKIYPTIRDSKQLEDFKKGYQTKNDTI